MEVLTDSKGAEPGQGAAEARTEAAPAGRGACLGQERVSTWWRQLMSSHGSLPECTPKSRCPWTKRGVTRCCCQLWLEALQAYANILDQHCGLSYWRENKQQLSFSATEYLASHRQEP